MTLVEQFAIAVALKVLADDQKKDLAGDCFCYALDVVNLTAHLKNIADENGIDLCDALAEAATQEAAYQLDEGDRPPWRDKGGNPI